MKRTRTTPAAPQRRGRPQKFGRPSQVVAITLPDDIVKRLQAIDSDIGWAIVQLVESTGKPLVSHESKSEPQPLIELARLPGNRGLIVVPAELMQEIPGVAVIPLSDGRAFLALTGDGGIAGLELALLDQVESLPARSEARTAFSAMREQLREMRHDPRLKFRSKSIILVEGVSTRASRRLARLRGGSPAKEG